MSLQKKPVCLNDFEVYAKKCLKRDVYRYYSAGTDENETLRDNKAAFRRLKLRPRMLRGVSEVDTCTTILGQTVTMPICVAPTALHKLAHPEGEIATARACAKAGTCMALSMAATTSMEEVANSAPGGLRWFQLYYIRDRKFTKKLIARAVHAGYKALLITVDSPIYGSKAIIDIPEHLSVPHMAGSPEQFDWPGGSVVSWEDIAWIKSITGLPVVLKGILTAEDAKLAVEHGADAIVVSNHGGRSLDGVLATIEALPEVMSAVDGQIEVYMDGGVRLGTDVIKALALGARAVFIGRPVVWGLAYQGEEGVCKVLQMLRNEFRAAMILSGCSSLADITPALVISPASHL